MTPEYPPTPHSRRDKKGGHGLARGAKYEV